MRIVTEILAEIVLGRIGAVGANDGARTSFTARAGDSLIALDQDLNVLGRWLVDPQHRGYHATSPSRGLALISGPDEVRLVDHTGRARWRYPHPPWTRTKGFESGCAWFDEDGKPYAVVPAASYDHCLVVCFDLASGELLAETPIQARPAGIVPVHHPDGWVGLSEGEGQDAARTWWVRSAAQPSGRHLIEVIDAGWDHWVLIDVDLAGSMIITTAHLGGPLLVRSFPSLEIVRSIAPPQSTGTPQVKESWDFNAFFVGDMIVTSLLERQVRFVAISPRGKIADLDMPEARYLAPAAHGSWLTVTKNTIQRRRITRVDEEIPGPPDEQIPGQTALW